MHNYDVTYPGMTTPIVVFTDIIWNTESSVAMEIIIAPTKRLCKEIIKHEMQCEILNH